MSDKRLTDLAQALWNECCPGMAKTMTLKEFVEKRKAQLDEFLELDGCVGPNARQANTEQAFWQWCFDRFVKMDELMKRYADAVRRGELPHPAPELRSQ